MDGFEYKVNYYSESVTAGELQTDLNEHARNGWRLKEIFPDEGMIIMERPKTYSDSDDEDD